MPTPRSLKGNLLNARDRLGSSIVEIVATDVAEHGHEVVSALRHKNPAAYARLISDLVHFKKLVAERAPPKRKPRPLRMKSLLTAMDKRPIDVTNPRLPAKHRKRWFEAMEALKPRMPCDLTPAELREAWGGDLSAWFETHIRHAARQATAAKPAG